MEILYFVWEVGWSIDKLLFKITLKYLDLDDGCVDGELAAATAWG